MFLSQHQEKNYRPKQDLAACCKSQSSFCIIAKSANGEPIGFIQYRFCWYKFEQKKAGQVQLTSYGVKSRAGEASVATVSEVVVFIHNLVVCGLGIDEGKSTKDSDLNSKEEPVLQENKETAKVLLTSLALEHASRSGVWYGMMESHSTLVPFFVKYFRMNRNCNLQESLGVTIRAETPLVCDLKKCSYRYAILLLEENYKQVKAAAIPTTRFPDVSERMIVNLADTTNAANNPTSDAHCFSNSNEESRTVQIRVVRKVNDEMSASDYDIPIDMHSTLGAEGIDNSTPIHPSKIDISADWRVLRSFPLPDKLQGKANVNGQSHSNDIPDNDFFMELKKKQNELIKLESSIEITSRKLLSDAHKERTAFEDEEQIAKRNHDKKIKEDYEAVLARRREAVLAWQNQQEQDMDAVCDVCFDGEVTPDNQIIFCDSCNVAVHQNCYGIEKVPSGNYFCHPCKFFEKDKEYLAAERRDGPRTAPGPLPIVCELCPKKQGAFVEVQMNKPTRKSHWVHTVCAKWHGMTYVDIEIKDKVEDLSLLKSYFKDLNAICYLCQSSIGATHPCREEGCKKHLHLTCARSVGTCSVQHGEGLEGIFKIEDLEHKPWTLACPEHSEVDPESVPEGSISAEQLVSLAKSYPPEPSPPKPFNKLNGKERIAYWSDKDNQADFFEKVMSSMTGARCAVCDLVVDALADESCRKCGVIFHRNCVYGNETQNQTGVCSACRYTDEYRTTDDYEIPKCHMCNQSGGFLLKSFAKPVSMKSWKKNSSRWRKSLFGENKFCHALCAM